MLEPIVLGEVKIERDYDLDNNDLVNFDLNEIYERRSHEDDAKPHIVKAALNVRLCSQSIEQLHRMGNVTHLGNGMGTRGNSSINYKVEGGITLQIHKCLNQENNVYIMDFLFSKSPEEQNEEFKKYLTNLKFEYLSD